MNEINCNYKPPFDVGLPFDLDDPGYQKIPELAPELFFFADLLLDKDGKMSKLDDETFRFLRYKVGMCFNLKAIDVFSNEIELVLRTVRKLYENSSSANNISC